MIEMSINSLIIGQCPIKAANQPSGNRKVIDWKDKLDTEEAAEYLGLAPETLATWRCRKTQEIPFYKLGRRVKYLKADLDAWLESHRVE